MSENEPSAMVFRSSTIAWCFVLLDLSVCLVLAVHYYDIAEVLDDYLSVSVCLTD